MRIKINFIFFYILSLLIIISKCHKDGIEDELEEDLNNEVSENEYGYFRESLKSYLIENKLFDSDREIEPDEMRKIFLEVISDGEPDTSPPHLMRIFEQLADYFVESYYNERKQIRGKDLYELFDIQKIYDKFGEIVGETPFMDDYNEEEDDLDNQDSVMDDL